MAILFDWYENPKPSEPKEKRTDFQNLCGMPKLTAIRHLRCLCSEEKLENAGGLTQPSHVPNKWYNVNNHIVTPI